jgi:hypothetical protein
LLGCCHDKVSLPYVHILARTHNLDYVSSNLQLSSIEEGLKTFRREAGEKPPREVGKRVKVRAYTPK